MNSTIIIRPALSNDLSAILNIYNAIIDEGGFTADLYPYTMESKKDWFLSLKEKNNIFVVSKREIILGYFYFSPWREGREALQMIAEISFYITKNSRGKGFGKRVMTQVLSLAKEKKLKYLLAILLDINRVSISLLKKFDFEIAGHLPGIAKLKDTSCGQYIMLKKV